MARHEIRCVKRCITSDPNVARRELESFHFLAGEAIFARAGKLFSNETGSCHRQRFRRLPPEVRDAVPLPAVNAPERLRNGIGASDDQHQQSQGRRSGAGDDLADW